MGLTVSASCICCMKGINKGYSFSMMMLHSKHWEGQLLSAGVLNHTSVQLSSVQLLSRVRLFATPWIAARQASLSITNSWSLLKLMSIESVMPSSHLILCCPLLLLPPIPPSIRVFPNESTLLMRWPKYWSFSFSISPSKEHPGPQTASIYCPTSQLSCPLYVSLYNPGFHISLP